MLRNKLQVNDIGPNKVMKDYEAIILADFKYMVEQRKHFVFVKHPACRGVDAILVRSKDFSDKFFFKDPFIKTVLFRKLKKVGLSFQKFFAKESTSFVYVDCCHQTGDKFESTIQTGLNYLKF